MSLDSIAKEKAKLAEANLDRFLKPADIRTLIDLVPEDMRAIIQLKYRGRSIFLRMYNDDQFWPEEKHFSSEFKRQATGDFPKIYALKGNLERSINRMGECAYNLFHLQALTQRNDKSWF